MLILVLSIVLENKFYCNSSCVVPQGRGVVKIQDWVVSW